MEPKVTHHSSQSHTNHELFYFHGDLLFERNPILILNEALDNLHVPYEVDEQTIENFLHNLEAYHTTDRPLYWLMMANPPKADKPSGSNIGH